MSEMSVENGQGTMASADEWTTAALAHASVALALIGGVAGGIGSLAGPVVALALYLGYREKSRFIAFHALQACVYQGVGILVYIALAAVLGGGMAIAWTVSGVLAAVLVGFLLMPFALVLTVLAILVLIVAPLAWVGYGLYAAYMVYHGQDFRYRWIGSWVEREVGY